MPINRPRLFFYAPEGASAPGLEIAVSIARRFCSDRSDALVLVVTDSAWIDVSDLPSTIEVVRLPSHRSSEVFAGIRPDSATGYLGADIHSFRESLLHETVRHFDPHLVFSFGSLAGVEGELERTLNLIHERRPSVANVLGLLDSSDFLRQSNLTQVHASERENSNRFDRVLVFGQQELIDPFDAYDLPEDVRIRTLFTGYINRLDSAQSRTTKSTPNNEGIRIAILLNERTSAERLVLSTVQMSREWISRDTKFMIDVLIHNPTISSTFSDFANRFEDLPNVRILQIPSDISNALHDADIVLTDGDYAGVVQAVAAGKKPIIVPTGNETTPNSIRALRFAELGLATVIPMELLSINTLHDAIVAILKERTSPPALLQSDGVQNTCEALHSLLDGIQELWPLQRIPAARLDAPETTALPRQINPELLTNRVIKGWDGTRFYIRDGDFIESQIERYGAFEFEDHVRMLALLRTGDNVIDGGANIGCHTCPMAMRVAPFGRVLAIEPVPRIAARLQANLELNAIENVEIHRIALDSEPGMIRLYVPDSDEPNQGNSSAVRQPEFSQSWIDVPKMTIDQLVDKARLTNVRLIKLDLEGLDFEGLLGAGNTIEKFRPIIVVEFHRELWKRAGHSFFDLDRLLRVNHGYSMSPWKNNEEIITVFARP